MACIKSTDAGDNWTKIGLDSSEHIARIAIDPINSNTIYVAVPGPIWSDSKKFGLYKSTDAGKTWEKILYVDEKAGCAEVVIDPSNPNTIYASILGISPFALCIQQRRTRQWHVQKY